MVSLHAGLMGMASICSQPVKMAVSLLLMAELPRGLNHWLIQVNTCSRLNKLHWSLRMHNRNIKYIQSMVYEVPSQPIKGHRKCKNDLVQNSENVWQNFDFFLIWSFRLV